MDTKDRIRGAFIGMLFGQINPRVPKLEINAETEAKRKQAGTYPLISPEEARAEYGNKGFDDIKRDYKLYDNYTQTKIIYDMLLKYGKISPEIFKDYLLELHKKEDIFKGNVYGPSTQRAVKAILSGEDIYKIGGKGITCGSAMRSLPIGMFFYDNIDKLIQVTAESSILTHNTDIAIEAAIITNVTLASLIRGMSKFEAIDEGIKITKKIHGKYGEKTREPKIHEKVQNAINLVKGKSFDEAETIIPEKIGVSWFARDTIPNAFANYIVVNNPKDSILLSARCGGDDCTPPEIACAFLGAEMGSKIFSEEIIHKIEKANNINIDELIDGFLKRI